MSDQKVIDHLNTKLRNPLKQHKKLTWFLKGYQLDDNNNVTHLNIFKSGLNNTIPTEIFQLRSLKHLDIRENNLNIIPDLIQNLKHLQSLDIRNNNLSTLPQSIINLEYLEKLYLGNNSFTTIPRQISQLESLWLIDLTENQLAEGCEWLLKAPMLTNIYLGHNQLKSFPFTAIDGYIDELVLIENPISDYPKQTDHIIRKLII